MSWDASLTASVIILLLMTSVISTTSVVSTISDTSVTSVSSVRRNADENLVDEIRQKIRTENQGVDAADITQ